MHPAGKVKQEILYWYGAATPRGLSYIGLPASVMFRTVSGMTCFQAVIGHPVWPIGAQKWAGGEWLGPRPASGKSSRPMHRSPNVKATGFRGWRRQGAWWWRSVHGNETNKVQVVSLYPLCGQVVYWESMVTVTVYMDVCWCVLSQKASDHGVIVREVIFPECSGDGPQGHTAAPHDQEIESIESTGPREWAL